MEEILAMFKTIFGEELPKINTFTISPAMTTSVHEVTSTSIPKVDSLQQTA